MARSHAIHVVLDDSVHVSFAPHLVAAFTVKHELETWADQHDPERKYTYYTISDGGGYEWRAHLARPYVAGRDTRPRGK